MKTKTFFSHLLLLIFIFGGKSLFAQTIISGGTINETTVRWTLQNSPYLIEGDLVLAEGATLLIDSNVIVEFQGNYSFIVNGRLRAAGARFQGKDLGSGKHVLWEGLKAQSYNAEILLQFVYFEDSKIGIDLIDVPYNVDPITPNAYVSCLYTTFANNQIGIRTSKNGASIDLRSSTFSNNGIGIQGGLQPRITPNLIKHISLREIQFEGNRIGLYEGYYLIETCNFIRNDSAIYNVVASQIDTCLFSYNGLGISGHSLSIKISGFTNNTQAIYLTPYSENLDSIVTNTTINTSHFENNDTAISMAANHSIANVDCNLFIKNLLALNVFDQTSVLGGLPFTIQRNIFSFNSKAIIVSQQTQNSSLFPGAVYEKPQLLYNSFSDNPQLFINASSTPLNLFKNYMTGTKQMLEFGITDGSDSTVFGFVNYTVSGDTSLVGPNVIVTKIEDVIKHTNYDSLDIAGTQFTIVRCNPQPGNPLTTLQPEENEFVAFPNPLQSRLNIRWTDGQAYRIYLFNTLGQAIPLPNSQALVSPVEIRLEGLPKGIYFLLLKNELGSKTLKVVKE